MTKLQMQNWINETRELNEKYRKCINEQKNQIDELTETLKKASKVIEEYDILKNVIWGAIEPFVDKKINEFDNCFESKVENILDKGRYARYPDPYDD